MGGNSRLDIIDAIGREYLTSNIENGEFSYWQALGREIKGAFKLDIRFYNQEKNVSVLVETKRKKIDKKAIKQLFEYVDLERELNPRAKIIAIIALTEAPDIKVWKVLDSNRNERLNDTQIKSFREYVDYFEQKNVNDKTKVLENTKNLNDMLHDNGVDEDLRSQFVGTCLLALKNGLIYLDRKGEYMQLSTSQIIVSINEILDKLLDNSADKETKVRILKTNILGDKNIQRISPRNFMNLLSFIDKDIRPYINESSSEGHDILSYFFTTFNKYIGRKNKNQAFTPNHIAHFMCLVGNVSRNTRVLDPTCGSGTFLVQAMIQALSKCETEKEKDEVKKEHIYGIEKFENVYGLSTTNMLIHGDGNTNIVYGSCFDKSQWIKDANIDLVLMNPPYNASKSEVDEGYSSKWGKTSTDPSKGLYFVWKISDYVTSGQKRKVKLITLLPMQCAIGTTDTVNKYKKLMLEKHTLDAVFSFPSEMFYPGASAVACCMVFNLGVPHNDSDRETFFGYFKNDGFEKRKSIGRVDVNNEWDSIEKEWLDLYEHRATKVGMSVTKKVTAEDEWCAEAYMETDYNSLTDEDFIKTIKDFSAYLVQTEKV